MKRSFLFHFIFLLIVAGCAGNSASVPAPLVEVPTSISFPSSVSIDVDTTTAAQQPSGIKFEVTPVGPFFEEITIGAGVVNLGNSITNAVLGPLSAFEIPTGTDVIAFSCAINENATLKTLQIDFGDYDFDGDGTTEGCSGSTGALPICYRVWVGGERRTAGVFETEFPTPDQIGQGRFVAAQVDLGTAQIKKARATYDHRNPLDKFTDFFVPDDDSSGSDVSGLVPHAFARQEGPELTARKTVNFSLGPLVNGITQWREGRDYWLGTINEFVDVSPNIETFSNQCAQISTQEGVNSNFCVAAGLNLDGLVFPSIGTLQDLEFPAGFPLVPLVRPAQETVTCTVSP
ncbi:MAG: hypothetical protein K8R69_01540 [Deltaproteobacteria bacterium]|nr:hypothetical protein [Deltaproteobacteria bacterium]